MDQAKKVRIEDLIAKAKNGGKQKTKDVFIKSMDGELSIKTIDEKIIFRGLSRIDENGNDMISIMEVTDEMIYNSCDIFKNKELQEICECAEPFDVVGKMLEVSERSNLFAEILHLNGFDDEDISTIVKNA